MSLFFGMIEQSIEMIVMQYAQELEKSDFNTEVISLEILNNLAIDVKEYLEGKEKINVNDFLSYVKEHVLNNIKVEYDKSPEEFQEIERYLLLNVVDDNWIDHIDAMDALKDGIGLRGYRSKRSCCTI